MTVEKLFQVKKGPHDVIRVKGFNFESSDFS